MATPARSPAGALRQDELDNPQRRAWLADMRDAAQIDVFASTHTCLAGFARFHLARRTADRHQQWRRRHAEFRRHAIRPHDAHRHHAVAASAALWHRARRRSHRRHCPALRSRGFSCPLPQALAARLAGACVVLCAHRRWAELHHRAGAAAMKLSIIMPVLNEAAEIEAALAALAPYRARGVEVIVVDGGSSDGTAELARALADRVIAGPRGRGAQMNAGASRRARRRAAVPARRHAAAGGRRPPGARRPCAVGPRLGPLRRALRRRRPAARCRRS